MIRSLGVEREGVARIFEWPDERQSAAAELTVDTLYSGLSAGTELTFLKGTNPYLHASWDDDSGVFRPGEPARAYPVTTMGYMEVARVRASRRPDIGPGQLVAMAYGHKTRHTAIDGEIAVPLPADVDPLLGVYVAQMGPICANGVLHAAAERSRGDVESLGDGVRDANVLVTGAGVVGLLTALFAHEHGAASVAVADPSPRRLAAVAALGLEPVDSRQGTADWCKRHWGGGPFDRGADVVFQCRGRYDVLHEALRSLRPQGSVIDMAFYAGGAGELRLGEEFHHNGLTIRCAQIGRVPRGLEDAWSRERLAAETIALLRGRGGALREHVITDVVPLAEGPAFLHRLSARRCQPIQAVFSLVTQDAARPAERPSAPAARPRGAAGRRRRR